MGDAASEDVVEIKAAAPRTLVGVEGRVMSVTVSPADAPPTLVARIDDGTGAMDAVFMGRREVPGIEPGGRIRLHGRVTADEQAPRIFNPRYELLVD